MTHDEGQEELGELLDALRAGYRDPGFSGSRSGGSRSGVSEGIDALPPEELEACDAPTRQAVGWLRDAWALEVAESSDTPPPLALARSAARFDRRSRSRRRLRVAALVSVAAAFAAVSTLLWRTPKAETRTPADTPVATGGPPTVQQDRLAGPAEGAAPPEPRHRDFGPASFRSREDGVEIVSGSVRLVLVHRTD